MSPRGDSDHANDRRLWLAQWVFSPLAGVTFNDWLGVLRAHGGAIPPKYWGRTAFTSAMALLNSALTGRERRTYDAQLADVQVRRPIFILGHHRSGTTHLWNLLSQDPRFASPTVLQAVFPHTFLTFEPIATGWARRFAPTKRPQDNVRFSPDAPIEEERALCAATFLSIQMARHFPRKRDAFKGYLSMAEATPQERETWKAALDRFARKLLLRHGADKTLLFKAPDHTAKIALIRELYPDARFIHIHRDPYTVFQSTQKMERTTVPLYAYQTPDNDTLDDFILWRYRAMYAAYFHDQPSIPNGQFAEVTFTEVDRDPIAASAAIYDALDLPDFAVARSAITAYADSIADYQKNAYRPLPSNDRERVADAWAASFARWGYAA